MEAPDLTHFWDDLGQNWLVAQQYIKLYPVCRWAQPPVEAVLALMKEHHFDADDVAEITIETFHEGKRLNTIPNNTEEAQYSLPYAVAVALVRGTIGVDEVTQNGLSDQKTRAIAKSVVIIETDEFNAVFPAHRIARAILKLKDGRVLVSAPTEAKGDPEDKITDAVLWSKFYDITVPVIGQDKATSLDKAIQALPDGNNVNRLFSLLAD
jgi:2-methylcitrate dehydratase PrpD